MQQKNPMMKLTGELVSLEVLLKDWLRLKYICGPRDKRLWYVYN